jgi:hypothetical protein
MNARPILPHAKARCLRVPVGVSAFEEHLELVGGQGLDVVQERAVDGRRPVGRKLHGQYRVHDEHHVCSRYLNAVAPGGSLLHGDFSRPEIRPVYRLHGECRGKAIGQGRDPVESLVRVCVQLRRRAIENVSGPHGAAGPTVVVPEVSGDGLLEDTHRVDGWARRCRRHRSRLDDNLDDLLDLDRYLSDNLDDPLHLHLLDHLDDRLYRYLFYDLDDLLNRYFDLVGACQRKHGCHRRQQYEASAAQYYLEHLPLLSASGVKRSHRGASHR